MTGKEFKFLLTNKFLLAIHSLVRKRLKEILFNYNQKEIRVLDVGGRKSPYTSLLPISVTISDIERSSEIQNKLNLGLNDTIISKLKKDRSNIHDIIIDDMSDTKINEDSFDMVLSIEVIEHVLKDEKFVENISKVLVKGGWLLLTTPNGEAVPCGGNPDHLRHYKKRELELLLGKYFSRVEIEYNVPINYNQKNSLAPWSLKKPFRTLSSMINAYINYQQCIWKFYPKRNDNTMHLIAIAQK